MSGPALSLHAAGTAGLIAAAVLGACAVGPDFVRPAAPDADRYTRETPLEATAVADGVAQQFAPGSDAASPATWRSPESTC